MKDLTKSIARALVKKPEAVSAAEEERADGILLVELAAAREEMGRIPGRQGRAARAVRTLLNDWPVREKRRISLQILEE